MDEGLNTGDYEHTANLKGTFRFVYVAAPRQGWSFTEASHASKSAQDTSRRFVWKCS